MSLYKIISLILILCAAAGGWFVISEIYTAEAQDIDAVQFEIKKGETVAALAERLEQEQVIRSARLFKKYLVWKSLDKAVKAGKFEVKRPITIARAAEALASPGLSERTITIIPGWTIRDIAQYLEREGIAPAEEITELVGWPAVNYKIANDIGKPTEIYNNVSVLRDKPRFVSLEGYLAPDTYRIYNDATIKDIIDKLINERDKQFTVRMYEDIKKAERNVHEVMTIASIVEREVRGAEDKKKAADIFWRRYDLNWALQADSTVHYAAGKIGDVFTTKEDRDSLSAWNTYRYPGLPPSPISNPSLESIMAAIYPEKNGYWYFATTFDGEVKYAKTLEEHNRNVQKYLR
ncbi:MAG: endolytic transglycosylase MltG [Patescibacteria group bacterium]